MLARDAGILLHRPLATAFEYQDRPPGLRQSTGQNRAAETAAHYHRVMVSQPHLTMDLVQELPGTWALRLVEEGGWRSVLDDHAPPGEMVLSPRNPYRSLERTLSNMHRADVPGRHQASNGKEIWYRNQAAPTAGPAGLDGSASFR